jgi:type IV pilus assembly protein PilX
MNRSGITSRRPSTFYERQSGVVLVVTLLVLVSLIIASIGLIRAVDATSSIAGNMAFKHTTVTATDLGLEAAITALPDLSKVSLDQDQPAGCTEDCIYYATVRESDTDGNITARALELASSTAAQTINWKKVPTVTNTAVPSGYAVRYVIDRLCIGPTPVTDLTAKCYQTADSSLSSNKIGQTIFTGSGASFFRVTTMVEGPRSNRTFVQAVISR